MSRKTNREATVGGDSSMDAAASILGVPKHVLQAAKKAGSPGFRHGRVFPEDVKAWLDKNPIASTAEVQTAEAAKLRRLVAQADREVIKASREKGAVVDTALVREAMARCCAEWNATRIRFEAEWPVKLAGLDVARCRTVLREMMTEVGAELAKLGSHFEG